MKDQEGQEPLTIQASSHGFEWWRKKFQYTTGLGLTPELKQEYERDFKFIAQNKKCKTCYNDRDWILNYSPTVTFLIKQIYKLEESKNSIVDRGNLLKFNSSKIICESCPDWKSGGFHPEIGILLCHNRLRDKWHLEDTLAHELIHWFDNLRWDVDWTNLKHHACSEIRASSLSGECRFWQEFKRRGFNTGFELNRGHQNCVKRRALLSVMGNPNCPSKEHAEKVVEEVWETCFNDTRPFDEIYR
ncbi:hypothetical protein KAFR_0F00790 [Kazachstania africana CBS 2517]|uniref:Mitochondrial inner membrane protease ATP23 n=1 Tax=Kazachstania africana (strain ATCC 22294 / BCRC 22015 / CBS 2517 / CECT 1963 / NBRC 1671 / NRRL Y-8276) TaxID=1071382 RepID=H2AWC6_KAZAF|nr:hypothetical protein KAFR_0F00790 [Kazachstania africana CBS 2517]CCF58676.1 hypothetical protein KAFR_0F00790 [Kazachstania africana CBS 2517]